MAKNPYEKGTYWYDRFELKKFKGVMQTETHGNMTIEVVKNGGLKKRRHGEYNLIVKHNKKVVEKVDLKERFSKESFGVHVDGDTLTVRYAVENGSIYLGYADDLMYDDFGINHIKQYNTVTGKLLTEKSFQTVVGTDNCREKDSKEYFNNLIGFEKDQPELENEVKQTKEEPTETKTVKKAKKTEKEREISL